MNEIVKVYKNSPVRIVEKGGEPWFVARDVCKVLEITKVDSAIRNLDADEKGAHTVSTPGGNQEMTIVSEAGLYSLILRSRKPEAKAFKRWVTHEVLPSIRKTGAYLSPGMSNEQVKALVATLEEEMYRRIQAENRLAKLEAHARGAGAIGHSGNTLWRTFSENRQTAHLSGSELPPERSGSKKGAFGHIHPTAPASVCGTGTAP